MKKFFNFKFNSAFDEKFESSLLTIFLGLLMGIFWILFIIWLRLIRERLPRDLTETVGEYFAIPFYIQLGLFIWFTVILVNSCYKVYKELRGIDKSLKLTKYIFEKLKKWPKLIDFLQFIANYVLNGPFFVWKFFMYNCSDRLAHKIITFTHKWFKALVLKFYSIKDPLDIELRKNKVKEPYKYKYIRRILYTWIILGHLPRILALSIFFYEVAVNKYIIYFYVIAPILLIPFIIRGIRIIIYDICKSVLIDFRQRFITIIHEEHVAVDCWNFEYGKKFPDIADKLFLSIVDKDVEWFNLFLVAQRFVGVDVDFEKYIKIPVYILLSLSFGLMLLIRLGLY